jgi:transposase-like protein
VADYDGDPEKRPDECKKSGVVKCPNMVETGGGFEGERYRCAVCGATYYLDYDDMK